MKKTGSQDPAVRQRIARTGGQAILAKYGPSYFGAIGKLGGLKVSQNRAYMSEIGKRKKGKSEAFMLETNKKGQENINLLLENVDAFDWSPWERGFIEGLGTRRYETLTTKQKSVITDLVEKLLG